MTRPGKITPELECFKIAIEYHKCGRIVLSSNSTNYLHILMQAFPFVVWLTELTAIIVEQVSY